MKVIHSVADGSGEREMLSSKMIASVRGPKNWPTIILAEPHKPRVIPKKSPCNGAGEHAPSESHQSDPNWRLFTTGSRCVVADTG